MGKQMCIQVQRAQRTPLKINKNKSTSQHIIPKLANCKNNVKIMKAAWDNRSFASGDTHDVGRIPVHRDLAHPKGPI